MNTPQSSGILFLLDDGWRHEKQVIMRYLQERMPLSIATHNTMTHAAFGEAYDVTLLPVYPVRKHLFYGLAMFFSRELDTEITRRQRADWLQGRSVFVRMMHGVRECLGRVGLRRYRYAQALTWLYRGSGHYTDLLKQYRVLVYNPVSVRDKRILFEAKAAGLKIISWVYSWDNPFKDNEFVSSADAYLVWNEENRSDVAELHGVPRDRIHVVGPAQMDYLKGRPEEPPSPPSKRYVLYPCATGREVYIKQEIEVILHLRDILDDIDPSVELLVRPYPFCLENKVDHYAPLGSRNGIAVVPFGDLVEGQVLIDDAVEDERYLQFRDAVCMVNLGSTIGLEAAYTKTPIIQLAYSIAKAPSAALALQCVFKNEHLRYIIAREYPNVVKDRAELAACLRDILSGDTASYRPYTEALRRFSDPLAVPCYKQVLCDTIRSLCAAWGLLEGASETE